MVILNALLAARKGSKPRIRTSDTNIIDQFLQKQTHLHLQNKEITDVENLPMCSNLSVLYLQSNSLENTHNLCQFTNLTDLHLQNNKIKKIEGIGALKKLKKLYLGHNCISEVSGLYGLTSLEELHLEKQKLSEGVQLIFEIQSISSLKRSLKILVVSGNGLRSVAALLPLENLEQLRASSNSLCEISDIVSALQAWPQLKELALQGNPICAQLRYREAIIAASYHTLSTLDGKQILPVTRSFLQSLALKQASRKMQPCSAQRASAHDPGGRSRNHSLQLAINSKHCARLPDLPPENDEGMFFGCHFPAWKSGKCRSAKSATSENELHNWAPTSARIAARRKSCSSTCTDLSQNLHISRL